MLDSDNKWHLNKSVPLSLIIVIILQTVYFTAFLTKLDSRVTSLEKDSIEFHKVIKDITEFKIRQEYMSNDIKEIKSFLKEDVDWINPKRRSK